jgi:hypothetical protein
MPIRTSLGYRYHVYEDLPIDFFAMKGDISRP